MKRKFIYNIFIGLLASIGIISSCTNADELKDAVFMTGTNVTPITRLTIDGPTSMGISATSALKADNDVPIEFKIDNSLVDFYNKEYNTTFKELPEGSYELSSKTSMIKRGTNVCEPVTFRIISTENMEDGAVYLAPISLVSSGNVPILESCKTQYIIINRTIITNALSLANSTRFWVPKFAEDESLKSIPKVSMECKVLVNRFCNYDPYISSVIGIEYNENFLLRFGDVTIKNNQLQLTAKDQVTPQLEFNTGKWYHIATVFDGSTIKMYINGKLEAAKDATRGPVNLFDGGPFNFGFSYNGRHLDGAISEARVWTKALSQVEIQEHMCYVDPQTPGLLAYWRFNEGEGNVGKDFTGHGYDAVNYNKGARTNWIKGVKCP